MLLRMYRASEPGAIAPGSIAQDRVFDPVAIAPGSGAARLVHTRGRFPDYLCDGHCDIWSVVAEVFRARRNGVSRRIPEYRPGFTHHGRRTSVGRSYDCPQPVKKLPQRPERHGEKRIYKNRQLTILNSGFLLISVSPCLCG